MYDGQVVYADSLVYADIHSPTCHSNKSVRDTSTIRPATVRQSKQGFWERLVLSFNRGKSLGAALGKDPGLAAIDSSLHAWQHGQLASQLMELVKLARVGADAAALMDASRRASTVPVDAPFLQCVHDYGK
ncbi:hypothetical protein G7046_g6452 [Stylonectria norvegica]|nr:hypothetical protein G7046_g6452 [Stylonectria norvegica]